MRDGFRSERMSTIKLLTSPIRARFFYFAHIPLLLFLGSIQQARSAVIPEPLAAFTLLSNADGTAVSFDGGVSLALTGGNNGTGFSGTTDLLATATGAGLIAFDYLYSSLDMPTFDWAGYVVNNQFFAPEDGFSGYPPTGDGVAR